MAPNQVPVRFIKATLRPIDVTDGVGRSGSRSFESALTAMIEFSVVNGNCPIAINTAGDLKSQDGIKNTGFQRCIPGRS
jgi:hypothetical protein